MVTTLGPELKNDIICGSGGQLLPQPGLNRGYNTADVIESFIVV